jgi:hypothetical protein
MVTKYYFRVAKVYGSTLPFWKNQNKYVRKMKSITVEERLTMNTDNVTM